MATKIRRCLFVGLGGTGMTALLHTKKAFVDTYGEVPPMIGFLGIDTDGGVFSKYLDSTKGRITLTPNEQKSISVSDAFQVFQVQKRHFDWVPEETKFALSNLSDTGAGAIRANGRFSLINNVVTIENAIRQKLGDITNATIATDGKYELLSNKVEVHMVFSLCGGTGAGSFIDMAYLIRRLTDYRVKLAGYAVLPDVFEEMRSVGMERVKPNAYGSLKELDYLMHFGLGENDSAEFDYLGNVIKIDRRPFNVVFMIDNKNKSGDTVKDVEQLAEMISSALTTAAGSLSAAAASTLDNIEQNIANGSYNIGDKAGWVSSIGASEIVFRSSQLAEIYSIKVAQRIIARLLNTCEDANAIANAWIDKPEVNIRENNGPENDNVIDFILEEKRPSIPMSSIDNKQNALPEVEQYIESIGRPKAETLAQKRQELTDRVNGQLSELVTQLLNTECGVGKTLDTLNELKGIITIFQKEMVSEKEELVKQIPIIDNSIKTACEELKETSGRFFVKQGTIRECEESVTSAAMQKAVTIREIARREQAIVFFNGLQTSISEEILGVENIKRQLKAANENLRGRVQEVQNIVSGSNNLFRIDLTQDYAMNINVKDDTLSIADFVRYCGGDAVGSMKALSADQIKNKLIAYAQSLGDYKRLCNRTIDDVLTELLQEDPEKFKLVLKKALHKSSPLLQENTRGYAFSNGLQMADHYYIGVEDKDNNVIVRSNLINNLEAGAQEAAFASIGMPDRIIFYHQRGTMPTFYIGPIVTYKEKYLQNPGLFHIDEKIRRRMEREAFQLMPTEEVDDTLELWVKGFVFGKIKCEDGIYKYQNEFEGEAIFEYWMDLGQYRDEAFDSFKRVIPQIRQSYIQAFDAEESRRGAENMKALLDDVKLNYRDKYSQCNMTNSDLVKKGNERIRQLLNEELLYVKSL
ncbi:MAG: hypothetical protein HUJ83_07960 [Veillonella sp.]|nr:hypothetical protein [Veillonella sp.]